jgi:hypothetical protein
MVDQSYIEEIKRRNAERAAKLKESLKIGDFSKLAPSGAGDELPGAVVVTPGAPPKAAGPPPPPEARPTAAGPPPPPPSRGEAVRAAPPPPPTGTQAGAAPPPPPEVRIEEPVAPTAQPEEVREPIVPSEGIWDEILGETVEAAPEEMPAPMDAGPSTSELEEFKVPLFDTSRVEEEPEAEEEAVVAAASDEQEGVTDEFSVPAFDSGPTGETTAVVEEGVEEEYAVPAFDSASAEAPVKAEEEFVVPPFDSAEAAEVAGTTEEYAVPAFDSAAPEPAEEYAVPAFDSSAPEPVEAEEAVEERFAAVAEEAPEVSPVVEEPVARAPVAEPVTAADNFIVLEVKGTELRLRRRNISLREAIALFEVAAEECKKLIEE